MSLHYIKIEGVLVCKTGLKIGGSKEDDNSAIADVPPILRHPITQEPYIPGSSLKGKLRSLLEYQYRQDIVMRDGRPCGCIQKNCLICTIFGPHIQGRDRAHSLGPTRLIVRDSMLCRSSKEKLDGGSYEVGTYEWIKQFEEESGRSSELKHENMIDRRTGMAADRVGKRILERIPAGAKFDFRMSLRIFHGDDEKRFEDFIKEGLTLLTQDALGGSGSRGYGEIELQLK
jgi:CRISPR-associated protein Csm3